MGMLLDFLTVPFLAVFAVVTSVEDWRTGRIRNKWVAAALIYCAAALLTEGFYLSTGGASISTDYLVALGVNAAISAAFVVACWLANLLSAADAKLVFAYSFLVPLSWYRGVLFPQFPAFALMFNAVLPLALYYAGYAVLAMLRSGKGLSILGALRSSLRPLKLIELLLFVTGFSWAVGIFLAKVAHESGAVLMLTTLVVLYWVASRLPPWLLLAISGGATAGRIAMEGAGMLSWPLLSGLLAMYAFIVVVFIVLLGVSSFAYAEKVSVSSLRPGMIVLEDIRHKADGGCTVVKAHRKAEGKELVAHRSNGLTKEEIFWLQALAADGRLPLAELTVAQSVPFAPFMAMGVLLTALAGVELVLLA